MMKNVLTRMIAATLLALGFPVIASAQNLVPNSSFEAGSLERRWVGNWDDAGGFHGTACVKMSQAPEGVRRVSPLYYSAQSAYFPVKEAGKPYVLSFYLKATVKMPVNVRLRTNAVNKDNPVTVVSKTVWQGAEWSRHVIKIDSLPKCPYSSYYIQVSKHNARVKGVLYLDAVQFEKGAEATHYKPAEDVVVGLQTDRPRNVFRDGRITLKILAFNSGDKPVQKHYDLFIKDFWNKTVFAKRDIILLCPPGKRITVPVSMNTGRLGSLRGEIYTRGGKIEDQIILSALPPVPMEKRALGWAYGAKPDDKYWMIYPKHLGLRYGGRWVKGSNWLYVQPESGDKWSWKLLDRQIADAEKGGIKFVAMYLGGVPKWAKEKKNKNRPHPYGFDLDDWERYVAAVAKRYAGRIDSWGIWNEPYFHDVDSYITLMKATYPVIKKANPKAEICGVDSPATTVGWTEKYLKRGGIKYLDVLTTHSYSAEGGYLPGTLERLHKWASYDGQERPVYNTETQTHPWWTFTWYTHLLPTMSATQAREYSKGLSAEEGAQRWTKLYITEAAMGVPIVLPHVMLAERFSPAMLRCTGGVEHDRTLSPKLTAWATAGRIIGTAKAHGEAKGSPLLRIMMFSREADAIAVLWTRQHESPPLDTDVPSKVTYRSFESAKPHNGIVRLINLVKGGTLTVKDQSALNVLDMMGNPLEMKKPNSIPVSMDPIYIIAKSTRPADLAEILKGGALDGFGRFKAKATVATGPEGDAGVVIAVQSLWPSPQKLFVGATGNIKVLAASSIETTLPAQSDIEVVLPFKNPRELGERVGPFVLTLKSENDMQVIKVPELFITRSYPAGKKIVLDGKLNEWSSNISLRLNTKGKILNEKAKSAWKGPTDSSLIMRSAYDEDYLYFAYEVTDNSIQRVGSPDRMYRGDCMEMFFDANVLGDVERGGMDDDDVRVIAGPSVGNKFPGGDVSLKANGTKAAAVKTPAGYTIEVAVPWSLFIKHGAGPYPGTVLGFTVNQYDKDAGKKKPHSTLAWAEKFYWWTDTGTWGRLLLVE